MKGISAFLLGLAPGSACAFYLQLVGYYTLNFHTNAFYVLMVVALFCPYPIIGALQGALDERYDAMFSTKVTYIFRTLVVQLLLAVCIGLWIALPQTPVSVLVVGFLLGTLTAVISTSGLQMVAALDPRAMPFVQFGREAGGVLPIIVICAAHLVPESPLSMLRSAVASLFGLIGVSALGIGCLNYCDMFDDTYCTLASGDTPSGHEPDVRWIRWWNAAVCYSKLLTFCLVTSMPLLLTPITTQHLAMFQFGAFLVGRVLVLPLQLLGSFQEAPWHWLMASIHLARTALFALLLWGMVAHQQLEVSRLFRTGWTIMMGLDAFSLSFADVTTGMFVEMAHRKNVARWLSISTFVGILLGVCCTLGIVIPSCRLPLGGIPSNAAIPSGGFSR